MNLYWKIGIKFNPNLYRVERMAGIKPIKKFCWLPTKMIDGSWSWLETVDLRCISNGKFVEMAVQQPDHVIPLWEKAGFLEQDGPDYSEEKPKITSIVDHRSELEK